MLQKNKYGEKADVYSFGVLLVELYTSKPPYWELMDKCHHAQVRYICCAVNSQVLTEKSKIIYRICAEGLRPTIGALPDALRHLVTDCFNEEPGLRPAFDEIVVRLQRLKDLDLPDPDSDHSSGEASFQPSWNTHSGDSFLDVSSSDLGLTSATVELFTRGSSGDGEEQDVDRDPSDEGDDDLVELAGRRGSHVYVDAISVELVSSNRSEEGSDIQEIDSSLDVVHVESGGEASDDLMDVLGGGGQ